MAVIISNKALKLKLNPNSSQYSQFIKFFGCILTFVPKFSQSLVLTKTHHVEVDWMCLLRTWESNPILEAYEACDLTICPARSIEMRSKPQGVTLAHIVRVSDKPYI